MAILIPVPAPVANTIAITKIGETANQIANQVFVLYTNLYTMVWNNEQGLSPQAVMNLAEQNNPGQRSPALIITLIADCQTLLNDIPYPGFVIPINTNVVTINANGTVSITAAKPGP